MRQDFSCVAADQMKPDGLPPLFDPAKALFGELGVSDNTFPPDDLPATTNPYDQPCRDAETLFLGCPSVRREKRTRSPVEFFNNMLHGGVSSVFSQDFS